MPPAARVTDLHLCPMVTGLVPHVGGPILPPCCVTVITGGMAQARVTDKAFCVGPIDMIVKGSPTVFVGGLMAARMGDMTVHGGVITTGFPTVIIGEAPGGSGGGGDWQSSSLQEARLLEGGKPGEHGSGASGGAAPAPPASTFGSAIKIEGDDNFKRQNGAGGDSTVEYNPTNNNIGTEDWQTRPPAVGLAHELVHATHASRGEVDMTPVANDSVKDPAHPDQTAKAPTEEVRTAGIAPFDKEPYSENTIRNEWKPKQKPRPHY
jgi:uncharacterized Zn-binding protein involved in type VI secretion